MKVYGILAGVYVAVVIASTIGVLVYAIVADPLAHGSFQKAMFYTAVLALCAVQVVAIVSLLVKYLDQPRCKS